MEDDRLANAVTDVYLVKSADQGRSFTTPVRVSDTPTFQVEGTTYGMGYAWNPCMASLGKGSLAVSGRISVPKILGIGQQGAIGCEWLLVTIVANILLRVQHYLWTVRLNSIFPIF